MAKKQKDLKDISKYLDMLNDPNQDYKEFNNIFNIANSNLKYTRLLNYTNNVLPSIAGSHSLRIAKDYATSNLEIISIKLNDYELIKNDTSKHAKTRVLGITDSVKKAYHSFVEEIKFMFDQYESLLTIITGDLHSKNSFLVNLKNLYDNNYMTYEEYNILKLFLKIRNILAHNNNVTLYDITVVLGNNSLLFNAIITLSKELQVKLTNRYKNFILYFSDRDKLIKHGDSLYYTYVGNIIMLEEVIIRYRLGKLLTYDLLKEPLVEDIESRLAFMDVHLDYCSVIVNNRRNNIEMEHNDIINQIMKAYKDELVILGNNKDKTEDEQLREDILTIAIEIEYLEKYSNKDLI
jgi:hypothetical protein